MKRDKYHCKICNKPGKDRQGSNEHEKFHQDKNPVILDAHHIADRNLIENGGYVKENGISLCEDCHVFAEAYHETGIARPGFRPQELYQKIGSSFEIAQHKSKKL